MPGPNYKYPLVGFLFDSMNPTFENYKKQMADRISCMSVLHKFIVFANSTDLSKYVFSTSKEFVPSGPVSFREMMGHDSWIFLQDEAHLAFRRKLKRLFERKALSRYIPLQLETYHRYLKKWISESENDQPIPMQYRIREMNVETSLAVICGLQYFPPNGVNEISKALLDLTKAIQLVNIPLNIPGTSLYTGNQARDKIINYLKECSRQAKLNTEKEAESLLEQWISAINDDETCREFSDHEIATSLLAMLFASQDASTSSIVWAIQLLADYPDVLDKIRQEQHKIRPNKETLTFDLMNQMPYLWATVKEILRFRESVTMMPYIAKTDTKLDGNPISKGTLVIATVSPTLHDPKNYENPENFNPDRFLNKEFDPNYLVFGHGPHTCIGKEYAMSHLAAFVAELSMNCEWEHVRTPDSDKIVIMATTYPADQCIIKIKYQS